MNANAKSIVRNVAAVAFAPAALTLVACANTTEATMSGKIGCPADRIFILEHEPSLFNLNTETWVATCEGRKFFCSSPPGKHLEGMSCMQAVRYSKED